MAHYGHLLIIDDNADRGQRLAAALCEKGYVAELLSQLDQADKRLTDSGDLDVVLCEVHLDKVSWDDASERLRAMRLKVPAIMLSDDADSEMMMMALRLGASDFFIRPLDAIGALCTSIDRCVQRRQIRRDLDESRRDLEAANTELRGTIKVLEQDQQAGRQVQLRMLPAEPLAIDDYVFTHTVIPSLYLSGDFTDYFTVGEHYVAFFIADVSGHGSSSAFCTVLLKNLFARKRSDYLRRSDETIASPIAMLEQANQELLGLGLGKYATMVVGVLDIQSNSLRYAVAGHLPQPVLVSSEGARYLDGEGSPVGIMEDAVYAEHHIDLPASFMLALFSDGILEILPPDNLIEKEKYFLDVFERSADKPEDIVPRLGLDKVETAPDDIAALFVSKRG